jgi:ParB-like chromosome segregation protein Spo0J
MTIYIDTVEQFQAIKDTLKPATIKSKKYGEISVPCTVTLLVNRELVKANKYNPNSVSKEKMKLLRQSIRDNGFCFPIVTIWDDEEQCFTIVDGFHRNSMGNEDWLDLDYIPLVYVAHDISQRMYATVQFNKARGVHQVDLDADVIRALIDQGNTEEQISEHLGIDLDTIHRYKQLTGISAIFANANWSPSWKAVNQNEGEVENG